MNLVRQGFGLVSFTVESQDSQIPDLFTLTSSGRFTHSKSYIIANIHNSVLKLPQDCKLEYNISDEIVLRKNNGQDVLGYIVDILVICSQS